MVRCFAKQITAAPSSNILEIVEIAGNRIPLEALIGMRRWVGFNLQTYTSCYFKV